MPLSRITSPFQSATANVYSPSANTITIRTSNADRVVVDSAGFTGFGASSQINHPFRITARPTTLGASPIAAWDGTTTPGISFNDNYPGVNFNGMYKYNPSGGTYYMGNGSLATIYLDPTSNNSDILISTANTGTANTISSPIERVRFNQFGIGLGQGVPSSGMGIRFPAAQSASSDPNTLDDYEEGSWSPLLQATGGNPTVNYAEQFGRYVKIGRMVTVQFYLATNSYSGGSGTLRFGGLPFASTGDRQPNGPSGSWYFVNFAAAGAYPSLGVAPASAQVVSLQFANNTGWGENNISVWPTSIYAAVQGTLTYFVA